MHPVNPSSVNHPRNPSHEPPMDRVTAAVLPAIAITAALFAFRATLSVSVGIIAFVGVGAIAWLFLRSLRHLPPPSQQQHHREPASSHMRTSPCLHHNIPLYCDTSNFIEMRRQPSTQRERRNIAAPSSSSNVPVGARDERISSLPTRTPMPDLHIQTNNVPVGRRDEHHVPVGRREVSPPPLTLFIPEERSHLPPPPPLPVNVSYTQPNVSANVPVGRRE